MWCDEVFRGNGREAPRDSRNGDESCVVRFSGGTDEKPRGIPGTLMKVVWQVWFLSGSAAVAAGHLVSSGVWGDEIQLGMKEVILNIIL